MKTIIQNIIILLIVIIILYSLILILIYYSQEKLLFHPDKLSKSHKFVFPGNFEEKWLNTTDGFLIHSLLFKIENPKGVILYLHGNAGSLNTWGEIAPFYNQLGYAISIPDYRGFGKSSGKIFSQQQMFDDADKIYDNLKMIYPEEKIIVIGYSLGTGLATYLASKNKPCKLILLAPYFSFYDLIHSKYPILPGFLLKYHFATNQFISKVQAPIALFHGMKDELIPYQSTERLITLCKPGDKIYLLKNQGHAGINENHNYKILIKDILSIINQD